MFNYFLFFLIIFYSFTNSFSEVFFNTEQEQNIRTAVVNLAIEQVKNISPTWDPAQRDCAGFIRFLYKQALTPRTIIQLKKMQISTKLYLPSFIYDTKKFFPQWPKIWQINNVDYGFYVNAETLIKYNFLSTTKSLEYIKNGDILAYQKLDNPDYTLHLMLAIVKNNKFNAVVYHNGAKANEAQLKIITASSLLNSPDLLWQPYKNNTAFLGIYSYKYFNTK